MVFIKHAKQGSAGISGLYCKCVSIVNTKIIYISQIGTHKPTESSVIVFRTFTESHRQMSGVQHEADVVY